MDRAQVKAMLDKVGIPVTYGWYAQGSMPKMPYIVFEYLYSHDIGADNTNWCARDRWQVDMVSATRDEELEHKLECALRNQGLFIYKTQEIDPEQRYARMIYRFTTIGD